MYILYYEDRAAPSRGQNINIKGGVLKAITYMFHVAIFIIIIII